jgi:hypothetical protein
MVALVANPCRTPAGERGPRTRARVRTATDACQCHRPHDQNVDAFAPRWELKVATDSALRPHYRRRAHRRDAALAAIQRFRTQVKVPLRQFLIQTILWVQVIVLSPK